MNPPDVALAALRRALPPPRCVRLPVPSAWKPLAFSATLLSETFPFPLRFAAPMSPRAPWTVVVLRVLMVLWALLCIVGSFRFTFPLRDPAAYVLGTGLLLASAGYLALAWRLPERRVGVWRAAVVLPAIHQAAIAVDFMARLGGIPPEDVAPLVAFLVTEALLFAPPTRRWYAPAAAGAAGGGAAA